MKKTSLIIFMLLIAFNCIAANKYWVASGAANWNNTANWSTSSGGAGGAAVPGAADVVIFTVVRNGNCNIDIAVNVSGIIISGYTGTISQNSNAIVIGSIGYNQNSGNFAGGNTTITLNDGDFNLSGGTFTATSGTMSIGGNQTAGNATIFSHSSGTFNHNNGKVIFNPYIAACSQYTYSINVIAATLFYDIEMNSPYQTCGINHIFATGAGDIVTAVHDLTHTDGILNGNFSLNNKLTINSGADGGTGNISFTGSGAQNYFQAAGTPRTCILTVNKTGGTVTPAGGSTELYAQGFSLIAGSFTAPNGNFRIGGPLYASQTIFSHQAGTFNSNNGTVIFDPYATACTQYTYSIDVLPATAFYDMEINSPYQTCGINHIIATATGDEVTATHNFTHTDGIINGLLATGNNLTVNSAADGGTGTITFNGAGGQTYFQAAGAARTCKIAVNKSSGGVTPTGSAVDFSVQGFNQITGNFKAPPGNFYIGGTIYNSETIFNHQSGTFNSNNGKVIFDAAAYGCTQYTYTVDVLPATSFNDIEINAISGSCGINHILSTATGDVVKATGNITHTDGLINGLFSLMGNLSIASTADGGTGTITFNGTGAQTYSQVSSTPRTCRIAVNKSSGAVTPATGNTEFYTQGFDLVAGSFTAPGGNFKIGGPLFASQTIFSHQAGSFAHNNGNIIFDAYANACSQYTYTVDVLPATLLYDVEINVASSGCGINHILATASGDVVQAARNLTHTDGLINGNFSLMGNFTIGANSDGGTGTITFNGTGAQTYSQLFTTPRTCRIAVNKASGAVTAATGSTEFYTQGFDMIAGSFTAPTGNFKIGGSLFASQTIFSHQGGTFAHNNGSIIFDAYANACSQYTYTVNVLPATLLYDVEINVASSGCGINHILATASGDVVQAGRNFTHTDGLINGYFALMGNFTIGANSDGGTGTITFNGTGAQTYSQLFITPRTCRVAVNKISGAVTPATGSTEFYTQGFDLIAGSFTAPSGNFRIGGQLFASQTIFNHQGGTFNHNNGNIIIDASANSCSQYTYTIDVLPATLLYDVDINSASTGCGINHIVNTATGDVVQAARNLTHTDGIISGYFSLKGNLTIGALSDGGTGTITFNGTVDQTYAQLTSTTRTCRIAVNKTAGNVLPAAGNTELYTQGFDLLAGGFTAPGGNFRIGGPLLYSSQTIFNHQAGSFSHNNGKIIFDPTPGSCSQYTYTLDVTGSTILYDVEMNAQSSGCGVHYIIASAAGDTVYVANTLTYTDGIQNAHIKAAGNVVVKPSIDGGSGRLIFTGSSNQNFDLTGATGSYDGNIYINKTGGNVTLLSDCVLDAPSQSIGFVKGNLVTSSSSLLIIGDNVTTAWASANSYADGPVRKTGNDAFTFPLGKSGYYAPISIGAPSLTTDHFTAEYFAADPNTSYDVTLKDATLDHISRAEYWNLNRTNGTSNIAVTLNWNLQRSSYVDNLADVRVARWNGATWKNHGNGGTTGSSSSGTVISSGTLSSFGPLSLASASSYNPLLPVTIWAGTFNNNWSNSGNWSNGVPSAVSFAIIPPVETYPTLSGDQTIAVLQLNSTTALTVSGSNTLSVLGNFTNNGAVTGTGKISMAGSTAQSIIGNGTVNNIAINNSAGVSIATGSSNMLSITGTLTPTAGTLSTNGNLTLKSDASGTAMVAQGDAAGNYISGNVIYERYIPARRAWRMISYPFKTSGAPSINAAIQEGVGGSASSNPNPGYGTHITGGTTANGFDANPSGNASMKELSGSSWVGITSTNQPITSKPGYFIFVRGSRANNLSIGTAATADNTTLRGTGSIKQGNQSLSLTTSGWQMVGNPFPSPVNLQAMATTNSAVINNNFKFWDPKLGGSNNVGGYVTASYNGISYDYAPAPASSISEFVQSGAAFFVDSKGAAAMAVNEAHKASGGSDNVFRPSSAQAKLYVNLRSVNSDGTQPVVDGVMVGYDENFNDAIDEMDATKLPINSNENLSVKKNGLLLSIERRKLFTEKDTIYLNMNYLRVRNYQLELNAAAFDAGSLVAWLEDAETSTSTPLNLADSTIYDFSINMNSNINRFKIVFRKMIVLPVTFTSITATRQEKNIIVQWKVEDEVNLSRYEVERSADGIQFTKMTNQAPGNSSYNWTDEHSINGINYYRIKMIDRTGAFKYSAVVQVSLNSNGTISIYPNPIENNTVQLQMNGLPKGKYHLNIFNNNGQVISKQTIEFNGNDAMKAIALTSVLLKGIYNAEITGPSSHKVTLPFSVQ